MLTATRHDRRTSAALQAAGREAQPALVAGAGAVRAAWLDFTRPRFADNDSAYFTGTYRDDYGFANGLMLPRNVHRDFRRFLDRWDIPEQFIVGVERHQFRDILHLHAVIAGPFSDYDRNRLKAAWEADRGFARVLPVLDGCESYVTKYALKGDTDLFDWRLS